MVVVTAIITGILVALFGELPAFKETYILRIKFPEAPGVTPDTPVRKSGILIGRVVEHEFADDGGVIVTARLNRDVPLKQNEVCRIKGSLLGDAVLEFVPSGDPRRPDAPVDPGELQQGIVAADPLDVMNDFRGEFSQAIASVVRSSDRVGQTAESVNRLLSRNEEKIDDIVSNADETLSTIKTTFENANKMIGDDASREQLAKAIQQMPDLMTETRQVVGRLNDTITLVDNNLRNIEDLTEPLSERGPQIVARVDQTLARLDDVVIEVQAFSRSLRNREGTLGQLIHNRELYDNLNQTVVNIEELTRKLRPIVDDARVFSDKIARHPGIIVRDAIKPQPGVKGVHPAAYQDPRTPLLKPSEPRFRLFQPR